MGLNGERARSHKAAVESFKRYSGAFYASRDRLLLYFYRYVRTFSCDIRNEGLLTETVSVSTQGCGVAF